MLDFPAWLKTHDLRRRDILGEMILGARTKDIADRFGCSQGRFLVPRRHVLPAGRRLGSQDDRVRGRGGWPAFLRSISSQAR